MDMCQQQTLERPYPDGHEWVPSEAGYHTITIEPLPIGEIAHFPSPLCTTMSQPHKCPLCDGAGKLDDTHGAPYAGLPAVVVCHGCNGQGIVWEPV